MAPEQEAELFIPTAFTPDGDEVNDKFIVKGDNVAQYSIKIYDSENLLIYSSTDMNEGWDGNYKGSPMPAANYLWTIEYTDIFGKSSKRTGYVELIR